MSDSWAQSCLKSEIKPINRQVFSTGKKFAVLLCRNAIALERSLILNLCERKVMRGMDLIEVARQCPDLTVSIRLGDLIEAN